MKKIIGTAAILAVIVVGGYYGAGLVTERTFNRNINLLNDSNGLSSKITRYDRGLFTSHVELVWHMQLPEYSINNANGTLSLVPAKTITVEMPLTIYHGPIMFTPRGIHAGLAYGHSEVGLPLELAEPFKQQFSQESTAPKLDLSLFISFFDATDIRLDIPQYRLKVNQGGLELNWLGMSSDHRFSSSLDHVSGSFTVNGVEVSKDQSRGVLDKLVSGYDLHRSVGGLYFGELNLELQSVVISENNKPMFEMKGLELSNSSDVEQSLFDSSTHASFASLLVDNKNYGPARVGFSIKNLDANVLVEINDKVSQTQNMSDMARQQALLALLPLLPKLVATGALIELTDLNVVIPEGVVQGAFKLQLPNDLNSSNPFQLVQKLTGEGSLHIPVPAFTALYTQSVVNKLTSAHVLVNQEQVIQQQVVANQVVVAAPGATTTAQAPEVPVTPTPASPVNQAPIPAISSAEIAQQAAVQAQQKIDQLIKVGALVKEGNDYVVKISINGGQLVVNGHPFDSAMLQF